MISTVDAHQHRANATASVRVSVRLDGGDAQRVLDVGEDVAETWQRGASVYFCNQHEFGL